MARRSLIGSKKKKKKILKDLHFIKICRYYFALEMTNVLEFSAKYFGLFISQRQGIGDITGFPGANFPTKFPISPHSTDVV